MNSTGNIYSNSHWRLDPNRPDGTEPSVCIIHFRFKLRRNSNECYNVSNVRDTEFNYKHNYKPTTCWRVTTLSIYRTIFLFYITEYFVHHSKSNDWGLFYYCVFYEDWLLLVYEVSQQYLENYLSDHLYRYLSSDVQGNADIIRNTISSSHLVAKRLKLY